MFLPIMILTLNILAFIYIVLADNYNVFIWRNNDYLPLDQNEFVMCFILLLLLNFIVVFIRHKYLTKSFLSTHLKISTNHINLVLFFMWSILFLINVFYLYGVGSLFIKLIMSEFNLIPLDGFRVNIFKIERIYTDSEKMDIASKYLNTNIELFNLHRVNPISINWTEEMKTQVLSFNTIKEIEIYIKNTCTSIFHNILINEQIQVQEDTSYFTVKNILIVSSIVLVTFSVAYIGYYVWCEYSKSIVETDKFVGDRLIIEETSPTNLYNVTKTEDPNDIWKELEENIDHIDKNLKTLNDEFVIIKQNLKEFKNYISIENSLKDKAYQADLLLNKLVVLSQPYERKGDDFVKIVDENVISSSDEIAAHIKIANEERRQILNVIVYFTDVLFP